MGELLAGIPTEWILGAIGILFLLTWIFLIIVILKLKKFQKAYVSLQQLVSGEALDQLLHQTMQQSQTVAANLEQLEKRLAKAEGKLRLAVNQTGIIRFNAFENMGSDLSFAVALTNQEGDGLVLTSINSREESRVYAKPLSKGESNYPLGAEEREAIKMALAGPKI